MSYFRPWESSTVENSQTNKQSKDADSVHANQQKFGNDALLDDYVNAKHIQVVARFANLMSFEGRVAQQLHRFYIESLTQLQSSSSSCTSSQQPGHQQDTQQSSKQQYEDLFSIVQKQCEILEEHLREHISTGISRHSHGVTSGDSRRHTVTKARRQLFL